MRAHPIGHVRRIIGAVAVVALTRFGLLALAVFMSLTFGFPLLRAAIAWGGGGTLALVLLVAAVIAIGYCATGGRALFQKIAGTGAGRSPVT